MMIRLPPFSISLWNVRQQFGDVVEVQAGGRLVEDEERARVARRRQVRRQFHALRLAAGKRGRRLPQPQVAEPHIVQHLQASAPGGAPRGRKSIASRTVSCSTSWMFRPL